MTYPPSSLLDRAAAVLSGRRSNPAMPNGRLSVGVDLGTATVVLTVLDADGEPLAGRLRSASVVRDGLVVDFVGAVDLLREMIREVEADLGVGLTHATTGYPPGVPEAEVRATAYVLEAAGLECAALIDEPSAANHVLEITDGAIVDVGGGTTGIAILRDGRVVHTADEATGGTHFNLVIAGALNLPYEEAERLKHQAEEQPRLLPLVRPVMEKVGAIVARQLDRHPVQEVHLVGGASAFQWMDEVLAEWLGLPVRVAPEPQLVTPLGIARAHWTLQTASSPVLEAAYG